MEKREMELESNWYAFYTRSRAEKKLFNRLIDRGFEVFLPLVTTVRQWSDRKKKVEVPLIRSYVFVQIEEKNIIDVLKTPGVVGVLKYLGKPAIVRDIEIENLRILVEGNPESIEMLDMDVLVSGDPIEVIKGAFTGLSAEYIRMKGKYRTIVRIKALGTVISVDIPRINIKKLKS